MWPQTKTILATKGRRRSKGIVTPILEMNHLTLNHLSWPKFSISIFMDNSRYDWNIIWSYDKSFTVCRPRLETWIVQGGLSAHLILGLKRLALQSSQDAPAAKALNFCTGISTYGIRISLSLLLIIILNLGPVSWWDGCNWHYEHGFSSVAICADPGTCSDGRKPEGHAALSWNKRPAQICLKELPSSNGELQSSANEARCKMAVSGQVSGSRQGQGAIAKLGCEASTMTHTNCGVWIPTPPKETNLKFYTGPSSKRS